MANSTSKTHWITALAEQQCYPYQTGVVKLIETHISWILLTGQFAYKVKKPVNFGFLDFSTLEKRRFYCEEEVRLNRRLAKAWYLEVTPITGSVEQPVFGGNGEIIEYAVKMKQFPAGQTLKERALDGYLTRKEIDQLSAIIADFHQRAEVAPEGSLYGESADIRHWAEENFVHIKPLVRDERLSQQITHLQRWFDNQWPTLSVLMQQRKRGGKIRECHGDLHLGNMTQVDGEVLLFDCIEFNPMLRWIDVVSEVAFVVMDLLHSGCSNLAYRFLNLYLQQTGDYEGLLLLRYYLAYRALVRAKVALLSEQPFPEPSQPETRHRHAEYRKYADLAESVSQEAPLMVVITHGFSGSGKSTYASKLAEQIGAIQLRSDIERKRLFGFQAKAVTDSGVNSGIYSSEAGVKTYGHLAELAKIVLNAGFPVIIDAAFLKAGQRLLFRQLAAGHQARFVIISFHAAEASLQARILARRDDPSEATVDVLEQQMAQAEPLTEDERNQSITINTESEDGFGRLMSFLKQGSSADSVKR